MGGTLEWEVRERALERPSGRRGPWGGLAGSGGLSPTVPIGACGPRAVPAPCLGASPPPTHTHRPRAPDAAPTPTPAIEDEYSGPKLEDGKVTITFMKELMQWYKDQKKLHRKCAYQVTRLLGAAHP